MKKLLLLFVASIFCFQSYAQGAYELTLAKEAVTLADRKFYIVSVSDSRIDKSNIGVFKLGLLDTSHPVLLKDGLNVSLLRFFDSALPKEGAMIPISIKVRTLKVAQWRSNNEEMGSVELALDYYFKNNLIFSSKKSFDVSDEDVMQRHEGNIREALKLSLKEFNSCDWLAKLDSNAVLALSKGDEPLAISNVTVPGSIQFNPGAAQSETAFGQNRNIATLGYQIGGYSLIGLDYEIRFHDYVGIHAGAGFLGYTYGLMIHTSPHKNSPFINFSFKDGGFGMLSAAAIEYGGHLVLNKQSGFALTFQIGLAKILKVQQAYVDALFEGEVPEAMLSMGIGFSW